MISSKGLTHLVPQCCAPRLKQNGPLLSSSLSSKSPNPLDFTNIGSITTHDLSYEIIWDTIHFTLLHTHTPLDLHVWLVCIAVVGISLGGAHHGMEPWNQRTAQVVSLKAQASNDVRDTQVAAGCNKPWLLRFLDGIMWDMFIIWLFFGLCFMFCSG